MRTVGVEFPPPGGHRLSRTTVPVEERIPTDRVHDDTVEQHVADSRHNSPDGPERRGQPVGRRQAPRDPRPPPARGSHRVPEHRRQNPRPPRSPQQPVERREQAHPRHRSWPWHPPLAPPPPPPRHRGPLGGGGRGGEGGGGPGGAERECDIRLPRGIPCPVKKQRQPPSCRTKQARVSNDVTDASTRA